MSNPNGFPPTLLFMAKQVGSLISGSLTVGLLKLDKVWFNQMLGSNLFR